MKFLQNNDYIKMLKGLPNDLLFKYNLLTFHSKPSAEVIRQHNGTLAIEIFSIDVFSRSELIMMKTHVLQPEKYLLIFRSFSDVNGSDSLKRTDAASRTLVDHTVDSTL
jgi:hypothetical protein